LQYHLTGEHICPSVAAARSIISYSFPVQKFTVAMPALLPPIQ